jgi:hypothetical protein
MFFGWLLIIAGLLILLEKTGFLASDAWDYIWPTLIIFWGLFIVSGGRKKGCWMCGQKKSKEQSE